MFETPAPRYAWGEAVSALVDLFNDGSFPQRPEGALLVAQGARGEVVRVGHVVPGHVPVYLVDFGPAGVVGCREEEILRASIADAPTPCGPTP